MIPRRWSAAILGMTTELATYVKVPTLFHRQSTERERSWAGLTRIPLPRWSRETAHQEPGVRERWSRVEASGEVLSKRVEEDEGVDPTCR